MCHPVSTHHSSEYYGEETARQSNGCPANEFASAGQGEQGQQCRGDLLHGNSGSIGDEFRSTTRRKYPQNQQLKLDTRNERLNYKGLEEIT